ncbi:SGNH hydrolase domain-containing protein, partial [Kocuria flava]
YLVVRDRPVAGPRSGVVLIVVSLVLAVVATRWVENPLKRWAWPERSARRLAVVVVVCLGLVAVPVLGWAQADARRAAQIAAEAERNNPGAAALAPGFEYRGDPDAPTIPVIDADYWGAPGTGEPCPADLGVEPRYQERCRETVPQEDPSATVLLLGNSHVHHWATAVEQLARENGWRVVTYLQPGCLYSTVEEQDYPEDCATWLEGTGPVIDAVDPDLVLGQGTRTSTTGEELTPGAEARMRELDARGVTFVGLRDTPRFEFSPPRCAQENGADDPACTTTGHPAVNTPNPLDPLADELAHVATVDMGDLVCPEGTCRPVVGNVHTYWDDDHLSIDYVRTLTPMLAQRLAAALAEDGVRLPGLP